MKKITPCILSVDVFKTNTAENNRKRKKGEQDLDMLQARFEPAKAPWQSVRTPFDFNHQCYSKPMDWVTVSWLALPR